MRQAKLVISPGEKDTQTYGWQAPFGIISTIFMTLSIHINIFVYFFLSFILSLMQLLRKQTNLCEVKQ